MNMKTFLGLLLISGISLVSCKKEETKEETANQKPVPTVSAILNGSNIERPAVQPQQSTAVPVPTQTITTQTVPTPTPVIAKGMNPQHGQPGHRCDIPVGAPLNSPPGKTPTMPQAVTQTQQNNAVKITPTTSNPTSTGTTTSTNAGIPAILNAPTTTAPGMNPPHGQAGHRCDIAVGAPLSKS
jgi:hypothetical protein